MVATSPVTQLQLVLMAVGYVLTGTGYFGLATDTKVGAFQVRVGLGPDSETVNAAQRR